jgi:hypothetical protein
MFIVRTKRVSLWRTKCGGYIAPPMPIDFISHVDRKFAAVVFAVCADELITILQNVFGDNSKKGEGIIVVYLLRLLQVIVMGCRYYPFLAAVYLNTIMSLTCATVYAWFDYAIAIVNQGMCRADFYPTIEDYVSNSSSITEILDYYGTGSTLIAIQLCLDMPRFVCLAYINVKLPMLLGRKIYYHCRTNITVEQRLLMKLTREERNFLRIANDNSMEMLYVANLFRSNSEKQYTNQASFGRFIPKFIYVWRDDFRFSTRIVCVYSSLSLLLYYLTIQAIVRVLPLLSALQQTLQLLVDAISVIFFPLPTADTDQAINSQTSNLPFPKLVRPYIFAVVITLIVIVIQLCVLLVNIRRNILQAFRGNDSEIPRRNRSNYVSNSSGNIHFAGYFIGYLIWGFIIIAFSVALLCFSIEAFITYGSVRLIEKILKLIIPSLLFVLFKKYLNQLLAQYVFIQHQGEVLSINNRRVLMIFIFFNFFLDAFLGFVSSIVRLIKSFIGGAIYMCRLDYSPLGRKLELFDSGFSAYCGFIHTECTHRHPVMLVFVAHLCAQLRAKKRMNNNDDDMNMNDSSVSNEKYRPTTNRSTSARYRQKWKLAVFLHQNPDVLFFRKAFLKQYQLDCQDKASNDTERRRQVQERQVNNAHRMSVLQLKPMETGNIIRQRF